ncbi:MAG: hypothetical protein H0V17_22630, partial [Deltaproteobacteria bacterium]|nr:hypothetical protein [Deltaproteobacteria bacterium]
RYEIATETTDFAQMSRFAVGSSPVIEERPAGTGTVAAAPVLEAVTLPPAVKSFGTLKLAVWAIVLTATGLGLGIGIASIAT